MVLADRQVSLGFVLGFNQLDAQSIPKRLLSSVRLLRCFLIRQSNATQKRMLHTIALAQVPQ